MKISNHRLVMEEGDNCDCRFERSNNFRPGLEPKHIILYTTNRPTVQSAVNYYKSSDKSVHLIISEDGDEIVQMVDFNQMAVNAYQYDKNSLAIELDYPGYVYDLKKKHYRSRDNYGKDEVLEATAENDSKLKTWPLYPKEQLDVLLNATQKLIEQYKIEEIMGQEDIFHWTFDPGPTFPKAIFREKTEINNRPIVLQETTREIHLRSGPGVNYTQLLDNALPTETPVMVNEDHQGWVRVEVMADIEGSPWHAGWLDARFVKAKRYVPVVKDGFLVTEDNRRYQYIKPYENNYDPDRVIEPKYLVMHVTTGTQMKSTVNWFKSPTSGVSAHLLIGRDGRVIQFVPFDRMAYHCGYGYWEEEKGMNRYAIGIELDNAAKLSKLNGGWHKRGTRIDNVKEVRHWKSYRDWGWEDFPKEQLEVAFEIAKQLVEEYNLKDIIGHDRVNLKSRMDPGPCFPMGEWRKKIFGREEPSVKLMITTAETPIYENTNGSVPDIEHPKYPGGLANNSTVRILDNQGKWALIKVKIGSRHKNTTGWVEAKYVNQNNKITQDGLEYFEKKTGSQAGPPPTMTKGNPLQTGTPVRIGIVRNDWTLVVVDDWTWKKAAEGVKGPNWTEGWVQSDHLASLE